MARKKLPDPEALDVMLAMAGVQWRPRAHSHSTRIVEGQMRKFRYVIASTNGEWRIWSGPVTGTQPKTCAPTHFYNTTGRCPHCKRINPLKSSAHWIEWKHPHTHAHEAVGLARSLIEAKLMVWEELNNAKRK